MASMKVDKYLPQIGRHVVQYFRRYIEPDNSAFDVSHGGIRHPSLFFSDSDCGVVQNIISTVVYLVQMVKHRRKRVPSGFVHISHLKQSLYPVSCVVYSNAREQCSRCVAVHFCVMTEYQMGAKLYLGKHGYESTKGTMKLSQPFWLLFVGHV